MENRDKSSHGQSRTVLVIGIALLIALLAYVRISLFAERNTLRIEVHEQGKQLALSLEDAIDVVRSHVFTARRTVEHALVRSEGAGRHGSDLILAESGALHVDPKAEFKPELHSRNLAASSAMLPGTAAAHQWSPIFQWTYYYDAKARWFLIYPYLSQEDLMRTTKTGDLSAAIRVFFDADGTRPLELIGPRNNSGRDMRWTSPYEDAAGKGHMVTLLAPVYLADEFVGAIGTDVTLKQLDAVLHGHAPAIGRSLVVDDQGIVLADSGGALQTRTQPVKVGDLYPPASRQPTKGDRAWQWLPLRGTPWTLWVHAADSDLNRVAIGDLMPSFLMAALLFVALLGVVWIQQRRSKALTATAGTLEETRSALARADRLGAVGGMIASVNREIEMPMQQAGRMVAELQSGLAVFREQQQRGLRRSELEDFVSLVGRSIEQLARQLDDANNLLQRFRQLALDQSSEQARRFRLRDVVENVLAVLRPSLKRQGCSVVNTIAADLELKAAAGAVSQILQYLLNDALERSPSGQILQLAAGWNSGRGGEVIEVTLSDAATSPPDPTTQSLALATRLAQQSLGGDLTIEAAAGGNRQVLRFPVAS